MSPAAGGPDGFSPAAGGPDGFSPAAGGPVAVLGGISFRHGTWHDVDSLEAIGPVGPAALKMLTRGGLRRYSVIDAPVRDHYPDSVRESLTRAGVDAADIDTVIFFSSTFSAYDDHADIIELCHSLGLRRAVPMGLFLGQCTNFSQALLIARALIVSQGQRHVLLIGADALDEKRASRILDGNLSVFSDTVVSCVVSGELTEGYAVEYVDHASEPTLNALDPKRDFLPIIDLFAKTMERLCARTYATSGHQAGEFSHLVLANLTVPTLKNYAMAAGTPFARVPTGNIGRFGHCFAYDQLITLATLEQEGSVRAGDVLHLLGVGGNYLFSSSVVRRL